MIHNCFIRSLQHLKQHRIYWFEDLLANVHSALLKWNGSLYRAQRIISNDEKHLDTNYKIKIDCYVLFIHFPPNLQCNLPFPNYDQVGLFREIKGTVVRTSQTKLLELKRDFICLKCHTITTINADYFMMYRFEMPNSCAKANCKGKVQRNHVRPPPEYCIQYQELKIQVE